MKHIARPVVPEFGSKAELFSYLRDNAVKMIAEKKAFPIFSENFNFGYSIKSEVNPAAGNFKGAGSADAPELKAGELPVDVIANVSGWCDTYMDVMVKDNWNKSISDLGVSGEKIMYHLKNHNYSTDAIIAKDASIYAKMIDLSRFNIISDVKKAQALMLSSTVVEEYDKKCFMLYRDAQVKQHSIGLQYIKLYLCLDSEEAEDTQYKDNWDKYYPQVINKEKVDSRGYFWAVVEAKILEVSVVLYGANELTPTENVGKANVEDTPGKSPAGTTEQPLTGQKATELNWEKMADALVS